jgi:hypothetical protein
MKKRKLTKENILPEELDRLLDGIDVNESLQTKDYKTLRDEMYDIHKSK